MVCEGSDRWRWRAAWLGRSPRYCVRGSANGRLDPDRGQVDRNPYAASRQFHGRSVVEQIAVATGAPAILGARSVFIVCVGRMPGVWVGSLGGGLRVAVMRMLRQAGLHLRDRRRQRQQHDRDQREPCNGAMSTEGSRFHRVEYQQILSVLVRTR